MTPLPSPPSEAAMQPSLVRSLRNRLRSMWSPHEVLLSPADASDHIPKAPGLIASHEQALLAWREWCMRHPGASCRLHLSGHWMLYCPAKDMDEAVGLWHHYLGIEPTALARDWILRHAAGTMACATPRLLVEDLLAVATNYRVQVKWMGPWWSRGTRTWLSDLRAGGLHRRLTILEPGLSIQLEAAGKRLLRTWSEPHPDTGSHSPSLDAQATASPEHLLVALPDAAMALRDDPATAHVLQGNRTAWRASR